MTNLKEWLKKIALELIKTLIVVLAVLYLVWNYVPGNWLDAISTGKQVLGSTITTIAGSDTLSASRSVINTNFSNLNTDKIELSGSNTPYPLVGGGSNLAIASSSPTVLSLTATSTTATSTFNGGLKADLGVRFTAITSCSQALETDSLGNVVCGTDVGAGNPNVTYTTTSGTKYYTASTTATDNLSWLFQNGFLSQASSTISNTLRITGALTLDTALTVANGGTGSTTFSVSKLIYGNGTTLQNVGTSTASCTTGVSCTSFTVVGDVAPSITATLGTSVDLTSEVGATILPIANGGTNNTTYPLNALLTYDGTSIGATSTQPLYVGTVYASSTAATSSFLGYVDIDGRLTIPNGDAPALVETGALAWDTTSGNLRVATSSTGDVVVGSATTSLYRFAMSSTSPDLVSGGILDLPTDFLAQTAIGVICHVDAGTSVVINLSDGTNDTNTVTCTTTRTQFFFTTNNKWNAYEAIRLEIGTVTGSVDYLNVNIIGYRTSN